MILLILIIIILFCIIFILVILFLKRNKISNNSGLISLVSKLLFRMLIVQGVLIGICTSGLVPIPVTIGLYALFLLVTNGECPSIKESKEDNIQDNIPDDSDVVNRDVYAESIEIACILFFLYQAY